MINVTMEVRGQLCGVVFLLPNHCVGSRKRTQTAGMHSKYLHLLSHSAGSPSLYTQLFPLVPSIRIETGPGKWTVSLEQGISTNDNEMCVSAIVFQGCLGNRCSLKPRGRLEAANGVVRSYSLPDRRGTWRPRLLPHMETTNAPFLFLRMYGLGMALSHPSLSSLSMSSCCGKAWC